MDGNVKLILGLLWTLIRHYQIRSTGKGLSTKQAMLNWLNTLIPELKVANFSTDWNNGLALCALVDRIKPGLCPHHATLKPSNGLENCELGMELAKEGLDIPMIIKPMHLSHPDVDEMSVMTYISYFCNPAIKQLLEWIKSKIPYQNISNFKTDWNNGINLAALIEAVSPGLFPDWSTLDPHDALNNLTRAMDLAEQQLGVEPVLKPDEMADPSVDELNVVTYLSRFKNAKAVPLPSKCVATGPGLTKAFVGKEATFQIDSTRGGIGSLDVQIESVSGSHINALVSEVQNGIFKVNFIPNESGKATIVIHWSDVEIPGSPFTSSIFDTGSFSFSGPQITDGQCGKVNKPVVMVAKGIPDISDLEVVIENDSGQTVQAKITPKGNGEAECSYTPTKIGKDKVVVKIANEGIPGSPFHVHIVDPLHCKVTAVDPPAGKPACIGKPATFKIVFPEGNHFGIAVEAKGQSQLISLPTTKNPDGSLLATYTPLDVGSHSIIVTCGGDNIHGSPLTLTVVDPSKVVILDAIPSHLQVSKQAALNVSVKEAGPGHLEVTSSNQSVIVSSLEKVAKDMFLLKLKPQKLGSSNITVMWSKYDIQLSPFTTEICDARECSAYGKNLASGIGKVEELFNFTVQAKNAGSGELEVRPSGPNSTYAADVKDNGNGTFGVSFTSYEPGLHSIDVTWGGEPIPNSPFAVNFVRTDAGQFAARGEGLTKCIARESTQFILLGPEAGLVQTGVLEVVIKGFDLPCHTVPSIPPVSVDPEILVSIEDQGSGNYLVNYAVPKSGDYNVNISCSGEAITGSPFELYALPAPEADKCRLFGHAIDQPDDLVVGMPLEFKVDTTDAGTGAFSTFAYDPMMKVVPLFLAEEKGNHNERIHVIKIDPQYQGRYTFEVKWSNKQIPGSPFTFEVGDPSKVTIVSIPDKQSFVAKVGEPIQVVVDCTHAGPGKLQALAKFSNGTQEPFTMKKSKAGQMTCSYAPKESGHVELLLTYSNVSILPSPWDVDIVNPNQLEVIPPEGYGKKGEHVRFVITGMKKNMAKKVTISAKHENHDATVKPEGQKEGANIVRFTPKMVGMYTVEVICARQHIPGSPFTVFIADPDACKLIGDIPSAIAIGKPVIVELDTSKCGPGGLSVTPIQEGKCLQCEIDEASLNPQKITLKPTQVGTCKIDIKWANYPVLTTPFTINVTDPSLCTFRSPQFEGKSTIKQNEQAEVIIDIARCGPCSPEVVVGGPQAVYSVSLVNNENSTYTATFSPWQTGKHEINIMVAGVTVPNCPFTFHVLKLINPDQIIATGDGLSQAMSNQTVPITVKAIDEGMLERGQLTYHMTYEEGTSTKPPNLQCIDKGKGTYVLTYTAYDIGKYSLGIFYEENHISGSPFAITIKPEPCADKCIASGHVIQPGVFLNLKEQAEIAIDTTQAGSGSLSVSGKQPDGRNLRIFVSEESSDTGKKVHHLIFEASRVGVYTVNAYWESVPIPGSPFQVHVVDPTRCLIESDIPDTIQIGQSKDINIDCTGAGAGVITVLLNGSTSDSSLTVDIDELAEIEGTTVDKYRINFTGLALGEVKTDIKWGGFQVQKTPFTVNVCDTQACVIDADTMFKSTLQVGVPFQFNVLTNGAGKSKLHVRPEASSKAQYTIDIQTEDECHTVTCTPWTVGVQSLAVIWGDEPVPNTPLSFSVCDPKKCRISGLPDSTNYIAVLGEQMTFSVDCSEAGPGELKIVAHQSDGSEKTLEGHEDGGHTEFSYLPQTPGSLELILTYNHINLLPQPWVCDIPDPTQFRATPPKGMGKLSEPVKILITGVTMQTQNFSITAMHSDHTASITTEHGKDENTFIAYFIPEVTGEYFVQVKHSDHDIDGSPFSVMVANPAGIEITSAPNGVVRVGEESSIIVDSTDAGPGDLSCHVVSLSGDLMIEPQILTSPDDEGKQVVTFISESVGKCQMELRWADYPIEASSYIITFVDPSKVLVRCRELESDDIINQGDSLHININCCEAGQGIPEVIVTPDTAVAIKLQDNKDGTFVAIITPWQTGYYQMEVNWNGLPVSDTPLKFETHKVIDPRGITAHGDGLKFAIAGQTTTVVINASEPNLIEDGLLTVKCFDPEQKEDEEKSQSEVSKDSEQESDEVDSEGEERKYQTERLLGATLTAKKPFTQWKDNSDGTYDLSVTYPSEGQYILSIDYQEQPIYQSPFTVSVKGAPSADKCIVSGPSIERLRKGLATILNQQIEIRVDSTDAGSGNLRCVATDPTGDLVRVYTHEEQVEQRQLHFLRFGPYDVGSYTVRLYWSDEPILGIPLIFSVVDPTRCLVQGLPLPNKGAVLFGETITFDIMPGNCGNEVPQVKITSCDTDKQEDEAIIIEPTVYESGLCSYHYDTTEPDNYNINVTVGGVHIPGSPFKCDVVDPNQFAICGLSVTGKYAYVGDSIDFKILGQPPEGEAFSVIAHGPHNDQVCSVQRSEDGFHECSFIVIDPGSYEVYVECARKHVPGSPFQVNVSDPSKCQMLEVPTLLQVGMKEVIIVKTSDAGLGEVSVLVNDEKEHSALAVSLVQQNQVTYAVTLEPQRVGDVKIDLLWADKSIPQCPLYLNICDANQCKVFSQALMSKKGKVGDPITFTVVTHRAGVGKLAITATGPSAQYTITPKDIGDNKYEAQFTPWQIGAHSVEVLWGKAQVPRSPFVLNIEKSTGGDLTCHATGDGLKKAVASKPTSFNLFTSEVGLVEKGALRVSVQSAVHGQEANVKIRDQNDGSYQVLYVPPVKGAYFATVTFYEKPIPGSPFKINCVSGPDASKCHVNGLHQNSLYIAGKPIEFTVDSSEAGYGSLRVYIQGPDDHHPKVYLADNGRGVHSVKFDAVVAGRYFIVVAWSDQHVPGSPFKIRVHPSPDASKVKVTGPGIKNGFLGDRGQIYIDTKEAGIGTLLIRVHGIKDAFKIQADPVNESEPRVLLASYSPKVAGDYDIFIRWSGAHIPGSPFKVSIKKRPGDKDSANEEETDLLKDKPPVRKISHQQKQQRRKVSQPKKSLAGKRDTSTDEESSALEEPRRKPGKRKKTSSVGATEFQVQPGRRPWPRSQSGGAIPVGPRRPWPRSQSGGAIPVGPIKPKMKMKKNPSFGQIPTGRVLLLF